MEEIQKTLHRFDQPAGRPLSYRQRTGLEFTTYFIPYLKHLEKALGREKVIETLREFARHNIEAFAEEIVKSKGKNDLSFFKEIFNPDNTNL